MRHLFPRALAKIGRLAAPYAVNSGFRVIADGWASAAAACGTGYAAAQILERVSVATQAVKEGRAAFERDSVLFRDIELNHPLICHLAAQAIQDGYLRVLDVGGSLGSTWWQHREILARIAPHHRWMVLEQKHFVEMGNRSFANDRLGFTACVPNGPDAPNVVLISGTLQYIEAAAIFLNRIVEKHMGAIIIDRHLQRTDDGPSQAMVQTVPARIYKASYPTWLFARDWLGLALAHWTCADRWSALGGATWIETGLFRRIRAEHVGTLWHRKP